MATQPDPQDRERASQEATGWLILLQEEPDDAEIRRRFRRWLHESPANAAAWAVTEHTSRLIEAAPPAFAARWQAGAANGDAPDTQSPVRSEARALRPPLRRYGVRIAALAAAACIALAVAPGLVRDMQADYTTGTAETRTVTLADGSTVVLAPGSAIAVDYAAGERRVALLAGEAFFDATPDPARPFRVAARDVVATVLGTRFDVRRGGDAASVAVAHGIVRVESHAADPPVSAEVEAGQSVRVGRDGKVARHSVPPGQVAAWRDRQLIARDRPMGDVIDQLRRYYGGRIVLADGAHADRRVTGVYNLADPVEAVRGVAHAHGATVRRITPWLLVISRL